MDTRESLLEQLRRSPDEEGWRQFVHLYLPLILGYLRRDASLGADAEDLAQEILLVVWNRLPLFQRERTGSFRAWLRKVSVLRLRGYYRKRRRHLAARGGDHEELLQLADEDSALSRHWDAEYNSYLVGRLLGLVAVEFPERDMRAFRRYVLDGVSPASKVADELGVTENVVLLAKSRIMRRLRELGEGFLD